MIQPAPQAPPPKKKMSGCMIALLIVGGLGLLCGVGMVIAFYFIWQDPDVQRVARAVGGGMELVQEAMQAPGTDELREAGCNQALAITPEQMREFVQLIDPDAGAADMPLIPIVSCSLGSRTLDCPAAARAYASGNNPPPPEFALQISQAGGQEVCSGVYAPDGTRLRDMDQAQSEGLQGLPPPQ